MVLRQLKWWYIGVNQTIILKLPHNRTSLNFRRIRNNKLCSLGSSLATFSYVSNSCLVCATVARITNRKWTQFVDKVGSTVFHLDLFWITALFITSGEADRPNYFTISHCRLSTIQPARADCITVIIIHWRCWHSCPCISLKTIPPLK